MRIWPIAWLCLNWRKLWGNYTCKVMPYAFHRRISCRKRSKRTCANLQHGLIKGPELVYDRHDETYTSLYSSFSITEDLHERLNYMPFYQSHACVWMREKAKSISGFPQSIPLLERIQMVIIATPVWKFLPNKLQPHINKMFFMGFSLFIKANTSIISGQVILTMLMHNATII